MPKRWMLIALLLAACATTEGPSSSATAAHGRMVTVEQIEKSLPNEPIDVGFDVDDTLLFSSPPAYYGMYNGDGPGGGNKYGDDPTHNPDFWADWNAGHDRFSMPKHAALAIVEMHKKRGDRIHFVTARPATEGEQLSLILRHTFQVNTPPVVFVGGEDKAGVLHKLSITVYYGDSDSDITAAQEIGARPIRFLRSPMSIDPRPVTPGKFGEEILKDSEN